MVKKINLFVLIAGLLIINIAGFFLRFYGFDTYFILLGFRFHFSIFIPFLFLLKNIDFSSIKEMFINPEKQRFIPVILIAFLPLLFVPLDIFILKEFNLSDKDYFFELGLSSIVDYPVYLVWNTPQIFMLFIILKSVIPKQKFIAVFFVAFSLFLYEVIPIENINGVNSVQINYVSITVLFLLAIFTGLIIWRIKNIYLFIVVIFTVLWGAVLFFGSSSKMVVNILLASQYTSWTGLVNPGDKFEYSKFLQPAYLFLILIFSLIVLKKNKDSSGS